MKDKKRLVVGVTSLPSNFEIGLGAGSMEMKPTLYDSLVGYQLEDYPGGIQGAAIGRDDRFAGRLAENWTVSADGRTVDFTLRDGVKSVSGKELDAEDVKYTLDRGFNVPGFYKWTAQVAGLASNEDVTVLDKRRVRFQLSSPSAFFLDTRVFPMNGIFDREFVQQHATEKDPWAIEFVERNPAGFGPYTISESSGPKTMIFQARPDYYRGKPFFDEVEYRIIEDVDERVHRLALGEIDYAHGLPTSQMLRLQDRGDVRVVFGPSTSVFQMSLRCAGNPLEDVHLRRAIAYGVPYLGILRQVFLGVAKPWKGLIPPVVEGYEEKRWPYFTHVDSAKRELSLAEPPKGFVFKLLGNEATGIHRSAGQRIVNALTDIGLKSELEIVDPATYMKRRHSGDYLGVLCESGPMVPDAGYALSHDFCSDSEGNDFAYSNPVVDEHVARGLVELDKTTRLKEYRKAQKALASDIPVIPIASPGFSIAIRRDIDGVAWYPDNVVHFGELSRSR